MCHTNLAWFSLMSVVCSSQYASRRDAQIGSKMSPQPSFRVSERCVQRGSMLKEIAIIIVNNSIINENETLFLVDIRNTA